MSVAAGVSDPDHRMFIKKSFHRRNDSGGDDLDVFEAAKYFSGYNEAAAASYNCATFTQKIMREERQPPWRGGGRISLDVVPMRNVVHHHLPQQPHVAVEKQNKEKKYKQPSSPGGRLASFLNSLFNQTGSKKKKSKSTTQSMKDEEESPGGRRKRRISISHFRSSSAAADTKSFYSSSSSGFRTPPPYAHTPTKNYKEFRNNSDNNKSLSKNNNILQTKPTALSQTADHVLDVDKKNRKSTTECSWLDEKLIKFNDGNKLGTRHDHQEKEFRKFSTEVDDGADSDSSSDLFELQNYDLGIYSNGLPVYETTHMDNIKRGAPISNAAL